LNSRGANAASNKKRLFITNGEEEALAGNLYYFLRVSNTKAISASNVQNEVNFGVMNAANSGLLDGVEKLLSSVMVPALSTLDDWGSLKTRNNPQVQFFVETLDQFVTSINGAKNNISNQLKLSPSDHDTVLSNLQTVSDYQNMSTNNDFVSNCEETLGKWCKQISKVKI
jgi:dynein heavy chain, axonemal